jgi:hypothetical protein
MTPGTSIPDRIGRRITDWWLGAVPAERLAGLRILIGAFAVKYLTDRYFYLLGASSLPPGTWKALVIATQIFAYAFAAGILYRFTAPVFALLLLFTLSYRNSWTMVFHTENLLVLHVLALALAPASDAWSVDRWWRKRRGAEPPKPDGKYAWAIRCSRASRSCGSPASTGSTVSSSATRSATTTCARRCSAITSRSWRCRCSSTRRCSSRCRS